MTNQQNREEWEEQAEHQLGMFESICNRYNKNATGIDYQDREHIYKTTLEFIRSTRQSAAKEAYEKGCEDGFNKALNEGWQRVTYPKSAGNFGMDITDKSNCSTYNKEIKSNRSHLCTLDNIVEQAKQEAREEVLREVTQIITTMKQFVGDDDALNYIEQAVKKIKQLTTK